VSDGKDDVGPVPVRDLMQRPAHEPEPEGEPGWTGDERELTIDDRQWRVRPAGAGSYGTGKLGAARLLAVHFFRDDAPDRPVREALVPAGVYPYLREPELRDLFRRATPVVVES
jgi:hypothetical protein